MLVVGNEENLEIFNIRKILSNALYKSNEEALEESKKSHSVEYNPIAQWVFAEPDSEEFKAGLRVSMKLASDIK